MEKFNLLPFQLCYILGVSYREILSWIEEDKIKCNSNKRVFTISIDDLINFLEQNEEYTVRLYYSSGSPIYDEWKKEIIKELDKRWLTGQSK